MRKKKVHVIMTIMDNLVEDFKMYSNLNSAMKYFRDSVRVSFPNTNRAQMAEVVEHRVAMSPHTTVTLVSHEAV